MTQSLLSQGFIALFQGWFECGVATSTIKQESTPYGVLSVSEIIYL